MSKPSSMSGTPGLDGSTNGTPSSIEALRDAGAGKVRGPNGRYVNKENPTPPAKKKPNIKYVKKCKSFLFAILACRNQQNNTLTLHSKDWGCLGRRKRGVG